MKVFAENRKAKNSYDFHEFYEAGVVLSGPETKSVRNGAVSIVDAFGIIDDEEAYVMEMNIEPYDMGDYVCPDGSILPTSTIDVNNLDNLSLEQLVSLSQSPDTFISENNIK